MKLQGPYSIIHRPKLELAEGGGVKWAANDVGIRRFEQRWESKALKHPTSN